MNHDHSPGAPLHALAGEPCPATQRPLCCSPHTSPVLCFPAAKHGWPGVSCSMPSFVSPLHTGAGGCPPSDWTPLPCLQALQLETIISALVVTELRVQGGAGTRHTECFPPKASSGPLTLSGSRPCWQTHRGPLPSPALPSSLASCTAQKDGSTAWW